MNFKEEEKYIKDFISNLSDEEFVEMLNECGHSIEENMGTEEVDPIINKLYEIVQELDARNISANCVIPELTGIGWTELCEIGIELFEQIK